MRTNKLRRWLLRGALIASTAVASAGMSQSAQAGDVIWNNVPATETAVDQPEPSVDTEAQQLRIENDVIWN